MTRPSRAQTARALRGITQEKNPKSVAAGKKRAAIAKTPRESVTVEEILRAQRRSEVTVANNKLPICGQTTLNEIFYEEARKSDNIIKNHNIRKYNVLNFMLDNAENVGKRLVKLALDRDCFKDAPASVRRLAMLDVLGLAGITADQAEKQSKAVHEINKNELEAFINSTKELIEKHDARNKGRQIDDVCFNSTLS